MRVLAMELPNTTGRRLLFDGELAAPQAGNHKLKSNLLYFVCCKRPVEEHDIKRNEAWVTHGRSRPSVAQRVRTWLVRQHVGKLGLACD